MAARDGASSVQGTVIRVTRLTTTGAIDSAWPVLTTTGFITASFSPVYEDGDEINQKAANGAVCVTFKADDSLTRLDFNLSLCSPDPEVAAMLTGGNVLRGPGASGAIQGYTSIGIGETVSTPIAIEIWSIANIEGKAAADQPYWHWVFPYVKLRYDGDREFTNGLLSNEFSGQALGNDALITNGLNPVNGISDDFVRFKAALTNPFSYLRTTGVPSSANLFSSTYPTLPGTIASA